MSALLFDTFTGRLRLEGLLTTRTALHIGAGGGGDPLATDLPVVRDGAGRPYIPGSSLKGVLRSAAEALFHGAPFADRSPRPSLSACRIMAGLPCVTHQRVEEVRKEKDLENRTRKEAGVPLLDVGREVAETVWAESCSVCRLFGSLELASRVRFPDLPLAGDLPPLELRNGVGIDRDKGLAANGVLYDFEAVPPGIPFRLTVVLDNPDDADAGLLLYLFHELDQGNLALGGKSSRGLGLVQVQWESIVETRIREENPFAELLSRRDLLKPAEKTETPVAEAAGPKLPATGDPAAWQTLADLILELKEADKSFLGQKASERGLTKANLNERLGLGLGERKAGKPWDFIVERLAGCGFLVERHGKWIPAVLAATEERKTEAPSGRPALVLQEVIDRFVGALGRRWEEAC
ncbi:MAG TPA: CRISPR-associated RAMP protein [Acidobacteria bacterium]|nr:CRISPR-associated RAMP protein [Acidobacteriota bacterium]